MSKLNTFDVVKKSVYNNDGNYYELSELSNSFANTLYNTVSKGVILSNGYSMSGLNLPTSIADGSQLSGTKRVTNCNTGSNKITDALDNTCYLWPVMLETSSTATNHCVIAIYRVASNPAKIKMVYNTAYLITSGNAQGWNGWKELGGSGSPEYTTIESDKIATVTARVNGYSGDIRINGLSIVGTEHHETGYTDFEGECTFSNSAINDYLDTSVIDLVDSYGAVFPIENPSVDICASSLYAYLDYNKEDGVKVYVRGTCYNPDVNLVGSTIRVYGTIPIIKH